MTDLILHQDHAPKGVRPSRLWLIDHVKFFFYRTFSHFDIPDRPWFDDEGTELFERLLGDSDLYIEYGSGGSTVLAASLGKSFVSVESDRRMSKDLQDRIGPSTESGRIVSVDIGATGAWGAPLMTHPNDDRLERWSHYVTAPWEQLQEDVLPDLVLVDGRFRVACALYSLIKLHAKPQATILFDDYRWRSHFHVIEDYARLERMAGRMAVLHPDPDIPLDHLMTALRQHIADWR